MQDKLRIFLIGFNKCGTNSFHELFNNYCSPLITSIHWNRGYLARDIHDNILSGKKPLEGYESYSVYSDMECFRTKNEKISFVSIAKDYFDLLDVHYPDSKFILNTRNVDNWISSRMKHMCDFSPMKYGFTKKLQTQIPYIEYHKQAYGIDDTNQIINLWKEEWYNHHETVVSYFASTPRKLLVFDIEKDSFSKITEFFLPHGFIFETDQLPHINKTQVGA